METQEATHEAAGRVEVPVRQEVIDVIDRIRRAQRGRPFNKEEISVMKDAFDNPTGRYEH